VEASSLRGREEGALEAGTGLRRAKATFQQMSSATMGHRRRGGR
jgi:hypothetical protein